MSQNQKEKEKLVVSLLMACHQPGGKKSMSPGPNVAVIAAGMTLCTKSGYSCRWCASAKTSTLDVLPSSELGRWWSGSLSDGFTKGYIDEDTEGGANHTDLRPTT